MKLPESKLKLTLVFTVVVLVVAIGLCKLCQWCGLPEQNQIQTVRALKEMLGWNREFLNTLAQVLIMAPLMEEPLFRSLLFRLPARLVCKDESRSMIDAPWVLVIAIVSSVLFSMAHNIDMASIVAGRGFAMLPLSDAFVSLFVLGFFWCWLYRRTRSIWCSMLSHFLFNLINLILLFSFS